MRKAIAIDFDGCICVDAYPQIGQPNWAVIDRAKAEQQAGAGLILWSCREGQLLQEAVDTCRSWGLTFDAVNENLPERLAFYETNCRKVGADEYWDDRAVKIPVKTDGGPQKTMRLTDAAEASNFMVLTLEELRRMDGELVWVTAKGNNVFSPFWGLVDKKGKIVYGVLCGVLFKHYGIEWLAYRLKPEETEGKGMAEG